MSEITIEVQPREESGKNANRRLRAGGLIPAVVYGGGKESVSIQINRKSFLETIKGGGSENRIFLLKLGDTGKERQAMVRDMQVHPITRQVLHIDIQRVLMSEKIRIQVPVELVGTPYGVKTEGGILDFVTREVHIECLPGDIPNHLELDITDVHVGQHVEAAKLKLPDGVTLLDEPDRVIVALSHARTEEAAAEGAADRPEPEIIKRGKTDED
jgi:large subunit ribosomal protein L25